MKQMLKFLPQTIQDLLRQINLEKVYEIRMRTKKPLFVNYEGEYRMLGKNGLVWQESSAYVVQGDEIEDTIYRAGDYSVYSIEDQIRQGFLTTEEGVRIGLAGRFIFEKGAALTVRDVTSLCIRVPHDVKGVGERIFRLMTEGGGFLSVLLMSLPGRGKTTALREIARLICERTSKNVLICDERGELSFGETGRSCDVLTYADKKTAFEVGIRTLRPDVIVTDELAEEDIIAVRRAIFAGVCVIASAHIGEEESGRERYGDLFDRYVLLDRNKVGEIQKIFDGAWTEIKC
ncbi:MAG: hypothetical protein IKC37_00435 [Clostridia bacterium]|nr:hypothetical protein [Clostridia bacterium]